MACKFVGMYCFQIRSKMIRFLGPKACACVFLFVSNKNVRIKKQSGLRLSITALQFWILSTGKLQSIAVLSIYSSFSFLLYISAQFGTFSTVLLVIEPPKCMFYVLVMKKICSICNLFPFPFYRLTRSMLE